MSDWVDWYDRTAGDHSLNERATDNAFKESGAAFDHDPEDFKPFMTVDWLTGGDEII